jgi:hypothetical protein
LCVFEVFTFLFPGPRAYDLNLPVPTIDMGGSRLKWPASYSLEKYNELVNSEDPIYLVSPNPTPFKGVRLSYSTTVNLVWENNFCFLIIFLDLLNVCLIRLKKDPYVVEYLQMPMWDRCMGLLFDKREGKKGLRNIAHHIRAQTIRFDAGDFGGLELILECLYKDLVGFRTLPRYLTLDGKIPSTSPPSIHLMEVTTTCQVCNSTRFFTSAYLLSRYWPEPPVGEDIYCPIANSHMGGGLQFGLGFVDTVGTAIISDSICNGLHGCGRKGTCSVTATTRPEILLVFGEQTVKHDFKLRIKRRVKVYPNKDDDGLYELAGAVFHEGNNHYVGIACWENQKFQFIDGFGAYARLNNKIKPTQDDNFVLFESNFDNYYPSMYGYVKV